MKRIIVLSFILVFIAFNVFPLATLNSVGFYRQKATNITSWGGRPPTATYTSNLTVRFKVYNSGPGHTAYLKYTTTDWATYATQKAVFQYHSSAGYEVWQAGVSVGGHWATFEYVICVEDHMAVNTIRKRYYNNNGNGCRIQATASTSWTYSPRP